ncbi:ribonuclease domain-containing protein [Saccharopolyspora hattusasensis]|uniref:ribonuclease domain-containing protein n=1 Tax=Saccharopolyspora hattusasensis TaxID=1128679 RepID=UPI003D98A2C0
MMSGWIYFRWRILAFGDVLIGSFCVCIGVNVDNSLPSLRRGGIRSSLAVLLSILFVLALPFAAQASPQRPVAESVQNADMGQASGVTPKAIPGDAWRMLEYLQSHNYTPPPGVAGGKIFRDDLGRLPKCDMGSNWHEFDVYPPGPQGRGPERIVLCLGNWQPFPNQFYSPDHYATFEPFIRTR